LPSEIQDSIFNATNKLFIWDDTYA